MSAIYKEGRINGSLGRDGVRRYKTRCKVIVHSHLKDEAMEIYDAVYAVDMSKAIKGPGTATFTLTPIQNFLGLIFPNDVVNIYFDIGDGSGWTRTFFGYVDRVEESYGVDQSGKPSTYYRVVCTDFSKAFEKTQIYFNPQLAGREDFAGYEFAQTNVDGLALLSKGVVVGGSPSDVIENIILMLLGFGTQFRLPKCYQADESRKRLREKRAEVIRGQLPPELGIKAGSMISQYNQLKADLEATLSGELANLNTTTPDPEARAKAVADTYGITIEQAKGDPKDVSAIIQSNWLYEKLGGGQGRGTAGTDKALGARRAYLLESISAEETALVDVVDIFTFIERRALDGFIIGKPVWQETGTIMSLIRSFSNEMVNELFLDLRPVNSDDEQKTIHHDPISGPYARLEDDIGGNTSDNNVRTGVTYVPAVVMREYPFSVVDGVDLSSVQLSIEDSSTDKGLGYMPFGAIFTAGRNVPGRHIVSIPNINLSDLAEGKSQDTWAPKHIDVAVISEDEIKKHTLGRSDNDHFNLFEMYSDSLLGTDQKFYMKDFLPIITPIHIIRNGLRLRTVTTTAARFSLAQMRNLTGIVPEPQDSIGNAGAVPAEAQTPIAPVSNADGPVVFSVDQPKSNFNYRLKDPGKPTQKWKWHHGIDITWKVPDPDNYEIGDLPDPAIPIRAIADGEIWVSAPDGVVAGYGNVIVIRHFWDAKYTIFSTYAHLDSRAKGAMPNVPKGNEKMRPNCFAKDMTGCQNGRMVPIPVKQGDIIGYLGRSGTKTSRPHLHFEITTHWPCAKRQGLAGYTPNILIPNVSTTQAAAPDQNADGRPSLVDTPFDNPPRGQASFDPVKFYSHPNFGQNLAELIGNTAATDDDGEQPDDRTEDNERPQDQVMSKVVSGIEDEAEKDTATKNQTQSRNSVDTASARKQLIRWAVLQDHWYQHNLEYLSGRIDMRGAPEIRVGYRLDIDKRNFSFYVEAIQHSWRFPNNMNTSLMVSRGQPNDPFPMYVLPPVSNNLDVPKTQRRTDSSRLGKYFLTPDPIAIRRSLFLRSSGRIETNPGNAIADRLSRSKGSDASWKNTTDNIENPTTDEATGITTLTYDKDTSEKVVLAGARVYPADTEGATNTDPELNTRQDTVSETNNTSSISKKIKR